MLNISQMTREQKVMLIRAAASYRSGEDRVNTVYMGSLATAKLHQLLGGSYVYDSLTGLLAKASSDQLDDALLHCERYIIHMQEHPTERCPCCGQIRPKEGV